MPSQVRSAAHHIRTGRTVKKLGADLVGIAELLEETSVLGDTLDAEGLVLATDCVHKVVVRDCYRIGGAANVRDVCRSERA